MGHPAFISYARKASREQAEALHQALGGKEGLAFLDSSGLEPGQRFPLGLAEALLSARVVVVLATKEYFRRWYCLWELETALGPFLALNPEASDSDKRAALAPLIIALPQHGSSATELLPLPPALQTTSWPRADELSVLEQLVRTRLRESPLSVGARLTAAGHLGAELRTRLLEKTVLPEPRNLASVRSYPQALSPSLGDSFVGRADDLWRIHYTLSVLRDRRGEGVAGAALTGALHGAGGFGKTRLALEYLHRFGPSQHPGGLFWVNAEVSPERLEEQFHGILRTLRPEVPGLVTFRDNRRDATREMTEALEAMAATERVLFVVDNVPEPAPGERPKALRMWCPALSKVSLLATSRARLDLGVEGVHALPVSSLSPEAAVALLTEGVSSAAMEGVQWRQIAEWGGHLPLALELLNRALRVGALEPGELLSRAEERSPARELDHQMEILRSHVPHGALRGITEAFSLSYAKLSPAEQRAARLIAQLAPEPIPVKLIEKIGSEVAADETRAILRSRHFVTPVDAAGDVAMYGVMHRVMAAYLREQSPQPLKEHEQVTQGLLDVLLPSSFWDPREWPLLKACLPHAQSVFEQWMSPGKGLSTLEDSQRQAAEAVLRLGLWLGDFLSARGLPGPAREVEERTTAYAREALGEEHPATLTAMRSLASTLYAQGQLDRAWELEQHVLDVQRRLLGEEHPETLSAMGNLASTLDALGHRSQARDLLERVLEVSRRVLGEEHLDTLKAMESLAGTLYAQGQWDRALELERRVLEVRHRMLGEEHPDTLRAMESLADTLKARGKLEKARRLEQHILQARRRTLGGEHLDTLAAIGKLAGTLKAQGQLERAQKFEQHVLRVRRRVLGEEHPDTLTAMGNLASTLYAQGLFERTRVLEQHVLKVRRRVLGEEHPDTLRAMGNLARTFKAQGQLEWARKLEQRVLEVRRRGLGNEHPDTLRAMSNLAETLKAQGQLEQARRLDQYVLEVRRRVLGEEHPDTLRAMGNLANSILYAQGNLAQARELLERVLEVSRRVLGERHPDTLRAMGNLASSLYAQGHLGQARELLERVLEASLRVLGEGHPDTRTARENLAITLREQAASRGWQGLKKRVLNWVRRLLGKPEAR